MAKKLLFNNANVNDGGEGGEKEWVKIANNGDNIIEQLIILDGPIEVGRILGKIKYTITVNTYFKIGYKNSKGGSTVFKTIQSSLVGDPTIIVTFEGLTSNSVKIIVSSENIKEETKVEYNSTLSNINNYLECVSLYRLKELHHWK